MEQTRQSAEQANPTPLGDMDEWEDFVKGRYPEPADADAGFVRPTEKEDFRNYDKEARSSVKEFYRLNHTYQTVDFVKAKREKFLSLDRRSMGIWEAMEYLNELVDDSDPDTDLSQLEHLLQTSEAARADGRPRWFILTALIHDLGKILCLWDEPQWAVVGDTFPVGCKHSDKIVYPEFFGDNPDSEHPVYSTDVGMYEAGCGLDNMLMSWGHDEYLYQVVKDHLPDPALYIIRYHSFYAQHREDAYARFMSDHDREMFEWVKQFNQYDLYSKGDKEPNVKELKPYYEELISEFFPPKLSW